MTRAAADSDASESEAFILVVITNLTSILNSLQYYNSQSIPSAASTAAAGTSLP